MSTVVRWGCKAMTSYSFSSSSGYGFHILKVYFHLASGFLIYEQINHDCNEAAGWYPMHRSWSRRLLSYGRTGQGCWRWKTSSSHKVNAIQKCSPKLQLCIPRFFQQLVFWQLRTRISGLLSSWSRIRAKVAGRTDQGTTGLLVFTTGALNTCGPSDHVCSCNGLPSLWLSNPMFRNQAAHFKGKLLFPCRRSS